ncbi:MAG: SUMF1/EgtB/PvdO family nonheme iron enzyme [Phycisphaeraceae bacterium]|nr:SUMF1/EgtB/PvdO family nonheme iron enzyme [Phycisphaeraceae bacterium]
MMNAASTRTLAAAALAAALAAPAPAELVFTTEYGIEFSTIGDIGNPVVPQSVGPGFYFNGQLLWQSGAVNYEYRMARTEVTVEQWAEFITAYRPHYTGGNPTFAPFTSFWISWSPSQQEYVYNPENAGMAVDPSWRNAAAFCNWMHNGKVNEAWAFQSGAYDIATFGQTPTGEITDQREHSPGARFWIPTHDEWIKAMHWDPDRYAPGEGGYWAYPTSSDDPPVPGVPGVGQTSGGIQTNPRFFPVGSYPDVQSPWGLLDGSGSEQEWTETWFLNGERLYKGSQPGFGPQIWDRIDKINSGQSFSGGIGFRLAASIPSAGTLSVLAIVLPGSMFRRRTR